MTITETPRPDRMVVDHRADGPTVEPRPLYSRHAGALALAAGVLVVVAQLVMLPFDPKDHIATSQSVVFQVGGVIYLAGFCTLLFALIGAHGWQAHKAGRFGVVALSTAVIGTMLLGGDLWFETFAIPWLADGPAPQVFDGEPSILLGLGAISSYLLFAIGWTLFGIASFRARVFPKAISVAIVVGGLIGFYALLSPYGVPLGVAIATLGVWMMRTRNAPAASAAVHPVGSL
jgi:hypothetical protein